MEPLRGGRESIPVDLRAEPSVLPGCLELHFPYLGGKSTHLHLAWANPGRNVQGTMVSSQSPPREPHLTRSTSSIAVPEGPRSRGGKQRFNRPVPTQRPLLLHMPPTLPALGGPPPVPGSKNIHWEQWEGQAWAGHGSEGGSWLFFPRSRLPSTPMPYRDSP